MQVEDHFDFVYHLGLRPRFGRKFVMNRHLIDTARLIFMIYYGRCVTINHHKPYIHGVPHKPEFNKVVVFSGFGVTYKGKYPNLRREAWVSFLKDIFYDRPILVLGDEEALKNLTYLNALKNVSYYAPSDFLEAAIIINSCFVTIAVPSALNAIANGLKVKRMVDDTYYTSLPTDCTGLAFNPEKYSREEIVSFLTK